MRPCNVEILAVLSDIAFGMHEIPHDGPYNTGMRNMEYALNLLAGVYAGNRDEPIHNGCLTYFNLTVLQPEYFINL